MTGLGGCGGAKAPPAPAKVDSAPQKSDPKTPTEISPIQFETITAKIGIQHQHVSGNSPEKHFPSANGSGVAMVDFDNDEMPDLYFLTCRPLPFKPGEPGPMNQFFLNRWPGPFLNASVQSKLSISKFSHGIATGDLDNDGFLDFVLTTYGGTQFYFNHGDGTFTPHRTFTDSRWGSSAAVGDFNEDGNLDVYVTHYGLWSIETNEFCGDNDKKVRMYCSPKRITPTEHAYYQNDGKGQFFDRTKDAGIALNDGRGQGVIAADVDLDGHLDLYVANDLSPNFLFMGKGTGKFDNTTDVCGASLNREGVSQASMGVDCNDVNRDGKPDLFVTNFRREYNCLYINTDLGMFTDKSNAMGVAADSLDEVGWGTKFVDYDNDGWLDFFVTNGHVDDNVNQVNPDTFYEEPAKVWRGGPQRFTYLKPEGLGAYFQVNHVGRGAAFSDLDGDGRIDIAVNHVDRPADVLRNVSPIDTANPTPWLQFVLVGRRSNRDAVGARLTLSAPDLPNGQIIEQITSGASYLSAHDFRVSIGIGKAKKIHRCELGWPSGKITTLTDVPAGAQQRLVEPIE